MIVLQVLLLATTALPGTHALSLRMNIPGPGSKPGPSPFQNRFKKQQYGGYPRGNANANANRNRSSNGVPSSPWQPPAPPEESYTNDSYRDWEENVNYLRQQSELLQLRTLERIQRQQEEMARKSREATQRAESMIQRSREAALRTAKERSERHFLETTRFISTPFVAFALSFILYPQTVHVFHDLAQDISRNRWIPVDGGELQWSVLLPALNGVVMTAVSLLYANLISATGSQLRERQIKIQESLRVEVMGIRGLSQLLPYYPDTTRPVFGTLLMAYIQELVIELDRKSDNVELRSTVPSISDFRNELHRASMVMDEEQALNDNIRERSYEMLDRVATGRMNRVTALQTVFPPLHYFTISALSVTILLVFLLETDRPVIQYLDSFQLRLMWGFLVGTITAIYCIGIDLNFPFVGTYTVPADRLLDESDELMRLIKGTFPTGQVPPPPSASE